MSTFSKAQCCFFLSSFFLLQGYAQKPVELTNTDASLTQYVDPFIGTGFHGHVFMGANVPFGAVQLGPVNMSQGWDWCSGYHYSDSTLVGFAHTHLSGTGIGDLGDITVMPVVGNTRMSKGTVGDQQSGYYSLYSHDEETATPGYYSVRVKRYNVKAELTASERVGFHCYTFPASQDSKIIIDLESGIGWDSPVKTFIQRVNDTTVSGYRFSKGWANDQRVFFTAIFSKPIKTFSVFDSTSNLAQTSGTGRRLRGVASFTTSDNEQVLIKVGISPVSIENAAANIKAEIPGWDFRGIISEANAKWNEQLGKIRVRTNDAARLRTFYTAMYHTMIAPSIYNDHNGDYRGTDKMIHTKAPFTNLTTFSLWDTYRATHPLYTIIEADKVNDMINSMLMIYKQQGKLPIWHLMGNETNTMPGYSSMQVVADAYLKGFRDFDTSLAWQAVKTTSMLDERGLKYVKTLGYIPADSMVESVALGLEYSIADASIALMAKKMGKTSDYEYYSKRGAYYKNYFDPSSTFMRGRVNKTEWRTPFSPFESKHRRDDFAEGNAWQYTWLVPEDVKGLIKLLGGEKRFVQKLDSFFLAKGDMGKEASSDITGLIGQYAHGNEPSHHITYLYAYAGQPWKTAEKVRYILDSFYTDKPDGLIGNEDVGQMSAWYVLSSIGFYQVHPAKGLFVFGSPVMDEVSLQLPKGKRFHILVKDNSSANKYIQHILLNGKNYTNSYITYGDIMKGGELVIQMGSAPSKTWGVNPSDRPW
ncbi:MAG: GH92 family glycosyl hydrolase [Flavisolibacter sp.]